MLQVRDVVAALTLHPTARRLRISFDPQRLQADLHAIDASWWAPHRGPYHNGGWESLSLWAPGGDVRAQLSHGAPFAATEALEQSPHFQEVLNTIPGRKNRVRLMRLQPGGHIRRHFDPLHQISRELVRLHIPVTTSPQVAFVVHDARVTMSAGEVWHVDVRFRHEVINQGATSRVHIVADVLRSPELTELLSEADSVSRGFLTSYFLRHAIPGRVRGYLRIRGN